MLAVFSFLSSVVVSCVQINGSAVKNTPVKNTAMMQETQEIWI